MLSSARSYVSSRATRSGVLIKIIREGLLEPFGAQIPCLEDPGQGNLRGSPSFLYLSFPFGSSRFSQKHSRAVCNTKGHQRWYFGKKVMR